MADPYGSGGEKSWAPAENFAEKGGGQALETIEGSKVPSKTRKEGVEPERIALRVWRLCPGKILIVNVEISVFLRILDG